MTIDALRLQRKLRLLSASELKEFASWGPLRKSQCSGELENALAEELGSLGYRFDQPEKQNEA
ncbi:hypothetical protein [Burkholderia sp. MBR-1]|uniref:hypothetical protein n=1 Tax=Burkholderia sp. MBR-1 TaxID=2732364 RepID=UPI0015EEE9EC|nr:hypothetical protein [Burkholderia sp. MBR-1]QMI49706.1 hypothetical protein MBR110_29935 [Burkholderia sp. MBR-1]